MYLAGSARLGGLPRDGLGSRDVIPRGSDGWRTTSDGSTYVDLTFPAGFPRRRFPAFAEKVHLKGVPVATSPAGAFADADTIVERTGDAELKDGVTKVPVVVRALHFAAQGPLKTGCGDWDAEVGLSREQRATEMVIRQEDERGGSFTAAISVDAVWTFTPGETVRQLNTSNVLTSDEPTPGPPPPARRPPAAPASARCWWTPTTTAGQTPRSPPPRAASTPASPRPAFRGRPAGVSRSIPQSAATPPRCPPNKPRISTPAVLSGTAGSAYSIHPSYGLMIGWTVG